MRRLELLTYFAVLGGVWVGCSPAPGSKSGDIGNGGGANASGTGGTTTVIGGTGGANGGTGAIVTQGGAANNGGTGNVCQELTVTPTPVTPTVLILVDNSSSMFEPRAELWDALYGALMSADGPVQRLQPKIRFGFASYKGLTNTGVMDEVNPACATITQVPYGLNNYDAINTAYTQLGTEWVQGVKWETPTGHAITRVIPDLAAYMPDPPGPKFILLVTDGNPNTCRVLDPQCGQDATIKAVQDAYVAEIGTYVLGIGDIVGANTGCVANQMRCGLEHLTDIANAGQGMPVQQPPAEYVYQPCVAGAQGGAGVLTGAYSPAGGTATPLTATNPAAIAPALETLLNNVVSCTVDMDAIVVGNPALGTVTVTSMGAARPVTFNDPNDGWTLEANKYQVTLTGQACIDYRASGTVNIQFPCEVAEPR